MRRTPTDAGQKSAGGASTSSGVDLPAAGGKIASYEYTCEIMTRSIMDASRISSGTTEEHASHGFTRELGCGNSRSGDYSSSGLERPHIAMVTLVWVY
jgi:hypothetical protein